MYFISHVLNKLKNNNNKKDRLMSQLLTWSGPKPLHKIGTKFLNNPDFCKHHYSTF